MAAGRLLVVVPDADLRGALAFALEAEGFRVTANELIPSLDFVTGNRFDCAVIDQDVLAAGTPCESMTVCLKARPVVLIAAKPLPWLTSWVEQIVDTPVMQDDLARAVRRALDSPCVP